MDQGWFHLFAVPKLYLISFWSVGHSWTNSHLSSSSSWQQTVTPIISCPFERERSGKNWHFWVIHYVEEKMNPLLLEGRDLHLLGRMHHHQRGWCATPERLGGLGHHFGNLNRYVIIIPFLLLYYVFLFLFFVYYIVLSGAKLGREPGQRESCIVWWETWWTIQRQWMAMQWW